MISLAQDLARKNQGYIPSLPIIDKPLVKPVKAKVPRTPHKSTRYVDEQGQRTYRNLIALKYDCSPAKVKALFDQYSDYNDVYREITKDKRADNHAFEVYFAPDGSVSTAKKLAEYYGTSRSSIQRAWTLNGKCSVKANEYLKAKLK